MDKTEFKLKVFSLSERLFPMVCRMLKNNANAEDAIQEIMMKLWLKRNKINKHTNITGLVFLTARNYCIDLLRKKNLEINDSSWHLEFLKSESEQAQLEEKELSAIIRKIIKSLPEQKREVIIMRDIDGYEFVEIAAAMKLKVEHVRVLLSRARKQVSVKLEKIYGYERV